MKKIDNTKHTASVIDSIVTRIYNHVLGNSMSLHIPEIGTESVAQEEGYSKILASIKEQGIEVSATKEERIKEIIGLTVLGLGASDKNAHSDDEEYLAKRFVGYLLGVKYSRIDQVTRLPEVVRSTLPQAIDFTPEDWVRLKTALQKDYKAPSVSDADL